MINYLLPFILVFASCEKKAESEQDKALPVSVEKVKKEDIIVKKSALGQFVASKRVDLRPLVSGELKEIHFKEGDLLTKGQLLFSIDDKYYQEAYEEALIYYEQEKSNFLFAKDAYERARRLFDTAIISKKEFQAFINTEQNAAATMKLAKLRLKGAKRKLAHTRVLASIGGRASKVYKSVGNQVGPSSIEPLIVIDELDPIYVDFSLTEKSYDEVLPKLEKGLSTVEVRVLKEQATLTASISYYPREINDAGLATLRAKLDNRAAKFHPGQKAQVFLAIDTKKDRLTVPKQAVKKNDKGTYAYVYDGERVDLRELELGLALGDKLVVEKGLEEGERVVVEGAFRLYPGALVDLSEKEVER